MSFTVRVTYNPNTGRIDVYRNGTWLDYWIDSTPLISGSYLGLRTRDSEARFDDIRVMTSSTLTFFHDDHLGSVSVMSDAKGQLVDEARYLPFGGYRYHGEPAAGLTDHGFTGHKNNNYIKLIYMGARWYSPEIGRFASADTIVPNPANPQSYNRFTYVRNNPLNYSDPTGHCEIGKDAAGNDIITRNDCTVDEFQMLSISKRIEWLLIFMQTSGFAGEFNDILGALHFFQGSASLEFGNGSWISWANAGVLQAVQNGYAIYKGHVPINESGGAAGKWAALFEAREVGIPREHLNILHWSAEQAGADYGKSIADSRAPFPGGDQGAVLNNFYILGTFFRQKIGSSYYGTGFTTGLEFAVGTNGAITEALVDTTFQVSYPGGFIDGGNMRAVTTTTGQNLVYYLALGIESVSASLSSGSAGSWDRR